jgi:hypothetical protein
MVYDASRGVTVLFGGIDGGAGGRLQDTWEWDGETWEERTPDGPVPSARSHHAMVYDASRGVTVLFGGIDCGFGCRLQDTWEWDGETWVERTPDGPVPPARRSHAMAYDAARGVTVLFGGDDGDEDLQDTWEWDGETWEERTPDGPVPSARSEHAMVYDASRGVTVLFGGWVSFKDTWEWDGETWEERTPDGPVPSWRSKHAMAYDASRGVTVLFGGTPGLTPKEDTWEWDGETWVERTPDGPVPSARHMHAMVYDASRGVTVLFGGIDGGAGGWLQDTWEWDGETWEERTPDGPVPSARHMHAMVYDASRGVTVLYGGSDGTDVDDVTDAFSTVGNLQDTWEWDGETWVERTPDGPMPSKRRGHAMAYDASRGVTVLFGGIDGGAGGWPFLQDTWEWNGETWEERTADGAAPSAAYGHAMVYDASRGVTVLFGDWFIGDDTWEWNGETWEKRTTWVWNGEELTILPGPSAAYGHAMVYDASRGVTVLFGGYHGGVDGGGLRDTWEWNGETWEEWTPDGPVPSARYGHAMAYDASRGVPVLFGGSADGVRVQDTWELDALRTNSAGHKTTVSWAHALADADSEITLVGATWIAGGLGHEADGECSPVHGAQLMAWTGLGWEALESTTAAPDAPDKMAWSTDDPETLDRLLFGLPGTETLNFAVTPTAPNGCGPEYGQVTTDYVEVTVGYRLPAELPPE